MKNGFGKTAKKIMKCENGNKRLPNPRKHSPRKTSQNPYVPLGICINGSIIQCFSRILDATCRLFEELVDWLIWKIHKSKN